MGAAMIRAALALAVLLGGQSAGTPTRQQAPRQDAPPKPLTILFFTASWCEPCRKIKPIVEESARKHPKEVELVTIDFDRAKQAAARWGVRQIPVVIVISSQGKVLLRCEGFDRQNLASLRSGLDALVEQIKKEKEPPCEPRKRG
jgi:thioredoxin 1